MKALFLSILWIAHACAYAPAHDIALAKFHILVIDHSVRINITFDRKDFSKSLGVKNSDVNLENIQTYLDRNTSFQFNDQVAQLKASEVEIVRDHLRIKGVFEDVIENVKTLKIENNCLTDVPNHSNIIHIDLNNRSRDYRMHKDRTVISLVY